MPLILLNRRNSKKGSLRNLRLTQRHWTTVNDANLARSVAKRMYRTLPEWQLKSSLDLLCDDPPVLVGAVRITRIHFTSPEVAHVATQTMAQLVGGVVEVMRASDACATSAAAAARRELQSSVSEHDQTTSGQIDDSEEQDRTGMVPLLPV